MGERTNIGWCHHTFNAWWGCFKVSQGCKHCYAEGLAYRYGHDVWGPPETTPRRFFGDRHWAEPLAWNAKARKDGERRRVFCSSMADVFEDHPALPDARARLWAVIESTPWLDWLLLTKRPEHIARMVPAQWLADPPLNVWLGTSVEDQTTADERIPRLLATPAVVRFLSCEPLLGPLDLSNFLPFCSCCGAGVQVGDPSWRFNGLRWEHKCPRLIPQAGYFASYLGVDWVIVGGESGRDFRPMDLAWARRNRAQCQATSTPFFYKQGASFRPGQDPLLDGREHHEFPEPTRERAAC